MRTFYIHATRPKWSVFGLKKHGHPFPIISWAIMAATRFNASHTLVDFFENSDLFHAYFNEIKMQPRADFLDDPGVLIKHSFKITVSEELYHNVREFCLRKQGHFKGYYFKLAGIALARTLSHFSIDRQPNLFAKFVSAETCSGMIKLLFDEAIKYKCIFMYFNKDTITEKDVVSALDQWPEFDFPSNNLKIERIFPTP